MRGSLHPEGACIPQWGLATSEGRGYCLSGKFDQWDWDLRPQGQSHRPSGAELSTSRGQTPRVPRDPIYCSNPRETVCGMRLCTVACHAKMKSALVNHADRRLTGPGQLSINRYHPPRILPSAVPPTVPGISSPGAMEPISVAFHIWV